MSFDEVIFLDSLPKLDLHGYDRESARVAVEDFIEESVRMKRELICIVHGIGTGTIKQTTHRILKQNKKVLDYKTYYYNQGCTVVKLLLDR